MPLDTNRIQAICFDIDGTLRNTDDHYVERVQRLFPLLSSERKARLARWLVMRLEGPVNGFLHFADRLGLDPFVHRLFELTSPPASMQANPHLIPGADAAVAALAKHFPLAVVSTRRGSSTRAFLEAAGIAQHFSAVATALTTPRGKPRPDPILWAAKQMGIAPENCLMVGDTVMDMRAGRAAGAQNLAVLSGFGEKEELIKAGADLMLDSVAGMQALFPQVS